MIEKLQKRLDSAEAGKLGEAECRQLYADSVAALRDTNERLQSLDYHGIDGKPRPARAAALAAGPDAVVAANHEVDRLEAETEVLADLRDRAYRAAEAAHIAEAPKLAKRAIADLPDAITRLQDALVAYNAAGAIVGDLVSRLITARATAEQAHVDCPALDPQTFASLAECTYRVPNRGKNDDANLRFAEHLARKQLTGVPMPATIRTHGPLGEVRREPSVKI